MCRNKLVEHGARCLRAFHPRWACATPSPIWPTRPEHWCVPGAPPSCRRWRPGTFAERCPFATDLSPRSLCFPASVKDVSGLPLHCACEFRERARLAKRGSWCGRRDVFEEDRSMTATSKLRPVVSARHAVGAGPTLRDARAIERAGFSAVSMTGAGRGDARLSRLRSQALSEMAANAGRIAASVDVPVIADADTGYGARVIRTVRESRSSASPACISRIRVSQEVRISKTRRSSPAFDYVAQPPVRRKRDFLIIARTFAGLLGFDEAIARANAALAAARTWPLSRRRSPWRKCGGAAPGRGPCLLNMVWRGKRGGAAGSRAHGLPLVIIPAW